MRARERSSPPLTSVSRQRETLRSPSTARRDRESSRAASTAKSRSRAPYFSTSAEERRAAVCLPSPLADDDSDDLQAEQLDEAEILEEPAINCNENGYADYEYENECESDQYEVISNDIENRFHSTERDSRLDRNHDATHHIQSSCSSTKEVVEAFKQTLNTIRETSFCNSNENSKLAHRMSSAKSFPTFSGDSMEWPRFKQVYEVTTELGVYNDKENAARLYDALRGDARNAVKMLYVSGSGADEIMRALERRFGNKKVILRKIIKEIKNLPKVGSNKNDLVNFISDLRGALNVTKVLGSGYLCSIDLEDEVLDKLPDSVISNYIRFAANESDEKSNLEKITEFLEKEVEMMLKAGVITDKSNKRSDYQSKDSRDSRSSHKSHQQRSVCTATQSTSALPTDLNNQRCAHCGRKNHTTDLCHDFVKAPIHQRWKVAKSSRLCYNCLREGHSRFKCTQPTCKRCSRRHHELLHYSNETDRLKPSDRESPSQALDKRAHTSTPTRTVNSAS